MATCDLDDEAFATYKKFKMAKNPKPSALILRVDKPTQKIVVDQHLEDISLEQLQDELSTSSPRYIIYVYKYTHQDARVSFPIVFIYYMPKGISPALAMTYANNKEKLFTKLELGKSFDAETPSTLTEEWLKEKLAFFK
ncbi:hypothetical protein SAMD00019534_012660 [Acytostelium subglobosum LB1]|uniref:hypothetical protein n=1 Tax=Acytostelium subglobosum LB1 TaxID=1410327 RepID=UPI00064491E2|nr:hypothetical protein SAMD00019534_012660 [Acytostelium subglobosum LB1]GAM18091.1 hypothetical protein SAMD00019534_012660 [Acytostelium subglobosum LB1]|eukprot:XP_012758687.1 hypothetical protein SAMD00019534_012660 [Acytostelium subglobosum LB1]